ncbi:MAG: cell surface protein [Planctomycetia bacterium]|nr:cell surface protein [Planctomycetia bacterium]
MKKYPRILLALFMMMFMISPVVAENADYSRDTAYKGPTQAVATKDGKYVYISQFDASKIAQVETQTLKVVKEIDTPPTLTAIILSPDEKKILATTAAPPAKGFVSIIDISSGKVESTIPVGYCPESLVLHPDGKTLYVANRFSTDVSVVDMESKKETRRIKTIREPKSVAVTPDGKTLFITNFLPLDPADGYDVAAEVTWVDTATFQQGNIRLMNGCVALHQVTVSPDGKYAFVTNNLARYQMPTTMVERGWMNTNAVAIIDAQERKLINVVLLDSIDLGAANPWGVSMTEDGKTLLVSHAGTHEVSIIDAEALFKKLLAIPVGDQTEEGKGSETRGTYRVTTAADVPNDLAFIVGMRTRVKLTGNGPRVMAVTGGKVYVPLYFSDSVAVIDLATKKQSGDLKLTPDLKLSEERFGQQVFNDGMLCFQQWQSCASCHPYVRADGLNWDLMNDGLGNPKNAKSLLHSHETPPTMISGIRADAQACVRSGFKHILFSVRPEKEPAAIDAYASKMKALPSPYLVDGKLSEKAERGKIIFKRVKCDVCHPEDWYFTDMQMHDVDTENPFDRRRDFDSPTLCEVWRTAPYLHDGRYTTVQKLIKEGKHGKQKGDVEGLTDAEIEDLAEYVLSL